MCVHVCVYAFAMCFCVVHFNNLALQGQTCLLCFCSDLDLSPNATSEVQRPCHTTASSVSVCHFTANQYFFGWSHTSPSRQLYLFSQGSDLDYWSQLSADTAVRYFHGRIHSVHHSDSGSDTATLCRGTEAQIFQLPCRLLFPVKRSHFHAVLPPCYHSLLFPCFEHPSSGSSHTHSKSVSALNDQSYVHSSWDTVSHIVPECFKVQYCSESHLCAAHSRVSWWKKYWHWTFSQMRRVSVSSVTCAC